MKPDRFVVYLALGVVISAIAAVTDPLLALLTLLQVVAVMEIVNLMSAPGSNVRESATALSNPQGE